MSLEKDLKELVDESFDYIFVQGHSIAETNPGDISPEQQQLYDHLKEQLTKLLIEQIKQNL
jgi:hypothetical protein